MTPSPATESQAQTLRGHRARACLRPQSPRVRTDEVAGAWRGDRQRDALTYISILAAPGPLGTYSVQVPKYRPEIESWSPFRLLSLTIVVVIAS